MPEEGKNKLAFQNHHKQLPAPFIIYADFEALIIKIEAPNAIPWRATPGKRSTMRPAATAVLLCDAMGKQSFQSSIEVPMQQSTS